MGWHLTSHNRTPTRTLNSLRLPDKICVYVYEYGELNIARRPTTNLFQRNQNKEQAAGCSVLRILLDTGHLIRDNF